MLFVLKFFWFICGLYWLASPVLFRRSYSSEVQSGALTADEVGLFLRRVAIAAATPCFLLGFFQLVGGHESPFFLYQEPLGNPSVWGSWAVVGMTWASLLTLAWSAEGTTYLARFGSTFGLPSDPLFVRGLILVLIPTIAAYSVLALLGAVPRPFIPADFP